MTKFAKFTSLLAENNVDTAIDLFRQTGSEILKEHRQIIEEGEYYLQDHTVFDELINFRLKKGDGEAVKIVERLLAEGVFINESTSDGFTPVSMLAHSGYYELVQHAVRCGADLNMGGQPALAGAVFGKKLPRDWRQIVTCLLDNGADPNGHQGALPPLFPAIASNHCDAIRLLASRGADVNQIHDIPSWGDFSGTSLHWAIRSTYTGHTNLETAKLLLEMGGDPTIKNKSGFGPVDFALDKNYEDSDNTRLVSELFSSKEEWHRASWKLNAAPPFRDNPVRKKLPRDDNRKFVWGGVEYRTGDRIEVIQRGGWLIPSLPNSPNSRIHTRKVIALPGLTGVIVGLNLSGSGDSKSFRATVDFEAGTWEERDNYGKTVQLPKCCVAIFPELLKIIDVEKKLQDTPSDLEAIRKYSSKVNGKGLNRTFVSAAVLGFIILLFLLF